MITINYYFVERSFRYEPLRGLKTRIVLGPLKFKFGLANIRYYPQLASFSSFPSPSLPSPDNLGPRKEHSSQVNVPY